MRDIFALLANLYYSLRRLVASSIQFYLMMIKQGGSALGRLGDYLCRIA